MQTDRRIDGRTDRHDQPIIFILMHFVQRTHNKQDCMGWCKARMTYGPTIRSDRISATTPYMMGCEEHLWEVSVLQRVQLSNFVIRHDYRRYQVNWHPVCNGRSAKLTSQSNLIQLIYLCDWQQPNKNNCSQALKTTVGDITTYTNYVRDFEIRLN
jgi:hypothetical protein